MNIEILPDKAALGSRAASDGADAIRAALRAKGESTIIVATGASQFEMLDALVREPDIDWSKVTAFHLDEYVGLPATHPASFRKYLQERFVSRVPGLGRFVPVQGDAVESRARSSTVSTGCFANARSMSALPGSERIATSPSTTRPPISNVDDPYIVVTLDEACRKQQLGEGWFPSFDAVPDRAISMSIRQIMRSRHIVLTVPDERKAAAVRAAVEGEVSPDYPGLRAAAARELRPLPGSACGLDAVAARSLQGPMMRSAGLFDLQVNGFAGIDFNAETIEPGDMDHALWKRCWRRA